MDQWMDGFGWMEMDGWMDARGRISPKRPAP